MGPFTVNIPTPADFSLPLAACSHGFVLCKPNRWIPVNQVSGTVATSLHSVSPPYGIFVPYTPMYRGETIPNEPVHCCIVYIYSCMLHSIYLQV